MDRLETMSILLAVAEAGSLSAAGRRLGMPLATVSRRVSDHEARLKTRLFNRSTRKLTLTDAGRTYMAACKRILEEVSEAERAVAGEYSAPKGDLSVTAPIVFGRLHVLPVVTEFLRTFPDINLKMVMADRVVDLAEERVDLAVRLGELPESGLIASRVGTIRRVVCGSPAYFAEQGLPRAPQDLREHACITFEGLGSSATWRFGAAKTHASVAVRSRLSVNTAEAAVDAAIAGVGIARVLSYQIASAVREGRLAVALQEFEPPPWPVSLVYRAQGPTARKLRAFLDFAAPRLKQRLLAAAIDS